MRFIFTIVLLLFFILLSLAPVSNLDAAIVSTSTRVYASVLHDPFTTSSNPLDWTRVIDDPGYGSTSASATLNTPNVTDLSSLWSISGLTGETATLNVDMSLKTYSALSDPWGQSSYMTLAYDAEGDTPLKFSWNLDYVKLGGFNSYFFLSAPWVHISNSEGTVLYFNGPAGGPLWDFGDYFSFIPSCCNGTFEGNATVVLPAGDTWTIKVYEFGEHINVSWEFLITEKGFIDLEFNGAAVPIPGAVWLLGSGLIGIVGIRRKFRK